MKRKINDKENNGFSLVELIIAIAILVILTGLLAPQFMRQIERSREAVCRKNMDEMLNIYKMENVLEDKYTVKDVVNKYQGKCPSKGVYSDASGKMGKPWIFCSIHDADALEMTPDKIWAEKLYNNMLDFVVEGTTGDKANILKVLKTIGKTYISNDTLREYLYNKYSGWPEMDSELLRDNGIYSKMYIQPYLNMHTIDETGHNTGDRDIGKTSKSDVLLFASTNGTSGGGWTNITLVYNPTNQKWYQAPPKGGISVYGKTWEEVEKEIGSWTPLK